MSSENLAQQMPSQASPKAARRFWELDSSFRCPAIGMCLSEAEQISVLKKANVASKDKTPFEIHELLVQSATSENQLSFRINLLLSQKFGCEASYMHSLDEPAMLEHWRECYLKGDYLAAFWGAVTRPVLSENAKYEIFGTVHMSMYKTAEEQARHRQRMIFLENRVAAQDEKIKALGASRRQLQKDFDDLVRKAASLQSTLDAEQEKKEAIPTVVTPPEQQAHADEENQRLRQALEEKTRRISDLEQMAAQLEKTVAQYKLRLDEQKNSQDRLRRDTEDRLGILLQKTQCSEDRSSFNLCRKRILIVGGIARMEAQYRKLIEERGGILEYHEGHTKNGQKQLENSLKRADIVLCPVNCNSHGACSLVKNLGKKHNKPVHMMPNFSLSAISQVLAANGN